MNAFDVVFLLITQELLVNGRGVLELREYNHLSSHFVQRLKYHPARAGSSNYNNYHCY